MLTIYKTRSAGPYHIANNVPCQDAYSAIISNDGYAITAVGDGLGSSKKSDIASSVATTTVIEVCNKKLVKGMNDEEILHIMKEAYLAADSKISSIAEADDGNYDDYDTTLCVAVYDGKNLYYGQSGDSGLVALTEAGEYIQVTTQQRNHTAVYPLCFGEKYWEFGKVDQNISAYVLVTDGIWEKIFDKLLENEEINMNINLLERMVNYFEIEENEVSELEKQMNEYWENCPANQINDDKTTVVVINTDRPPARKDDDYYSEPDWEKLYEKMLEKRKAKMKKMMTEAEPLQYEVCDSTDGEDATDEISKLGKLDNSDKSGETDKLVIDDNADFDKASNDYSEPIKKETALPTHIDIKI